MGTLWERIFEAFGGKENYVVVLATVAGDPKALEGFEIPRNFIVRRKCPQLEVLKVADAFITHGGANSMIESINNHVPMLVLPWFSDQYDNAKLVSEQGVGLHYDRPLPDCTADFLASDILRLLINRVTFISNAQRLQKSLEKAGGAEKASRASCCDSALLGNALCLGVITMRVLLVVVCKIRSNERRHRGAARLEILVPLQTMGKGPTHSGMSICLGDICALGSLL